MNSFRPVALRLALSDVAALAAVTARTLAMRRPLAVAFRLRLRLAPAALQPGWTKVLELPAARRE
jgi:hypothetical protein